MAQASGRNNGLLEDSAKNQATLDKLHCVSCSWLSSERYWLGESHIQCTCAGRRFCIWLHAIISLSRDMASKLTSFLAS